VLAASCVVLFGFSPTLNPIDVFTGRLFLVAVPDVSGLTQPKALLALQSSRLVGAVEFDYSPTVPAGKVMAQKPRAGATVRRGSTATIVVSRGTNYFTLADFTGRQEKEVTAELRKESVTVVATKGNNDDSVAGTVLGQSPAAGVVIAGGSRVNLIVSLGPATRPVPEIKTLTLEGAAFLLGKSGFLMGTVTIADDPIIPKGGVVSSDPAVGAVVAKDTKVNVVLSAGRAPVALGSYVGSKQTKAAEEMSGLGLVIAEVTQLGPIRDPQDGVVLEQNPAAGTMVRPGDVVTLTVRRATKPPPTAPPTTAPPPTTVAPPTTAAAATTAVPTPTGAP
jgi:serine/threonine-protein kinase